MIHTMVVIAGSTQSPDVPPVVLSIVGMCVQVLVHESHLTSGALDKIQAALQEAGVKVSAALVQRSCSTLSCRDKRQLSLQSGSTSVAGARTLHLQPDLCQVPC